MVLSTLIAVSRPIKGKRPKSGRADASRASYAQDAASHGHARWRTGQQALLALAFDPDAPLPPELYDGRPLPTSGAQRLYETARKHPGLSLRELAGQLGWGSTQTQFVGTPEQLADHIIASQDAGAVDGFTIMGSTLPYELRTFADQVVPILQARGRFRTEYSDDTLRDHLGLDRPAGHRTPAAQIAGGGRQS